MRRFVILGCVVLLLAAALVRAEETLRIQPFISDNHVLVSFELDDAYTPEVREAIASGLRTTFSYQLELRTPGFSIAPSAPPSWR